MPYFENGDGTTLQGFAVRGRRKYVYRLTWDARSSSRFVAADGLTHDYTLHTMTSDVD